ncbi:hypothetical protein BDV96DRAFT_234859 [Lophiotrema nucula]|uniref:Clr5 domain-containing protein n=1 Tax=Lophiotrema nucula TaxID=690887 RepID=A0A6A5YSE2_9PLEO|nr:hypothetical protein BDV96DRAFT_234859 [Lophiotrema nucula]
MWLPKQFPVRCHRRLSSSILCTPMWLPAGPQPSVEIPNEPSTPTGYLSDMQERKAEALESIEGGLDPSISLAYRKLQLPSTLSSSSVVRESTVDAKPSKRTLRSSDWKPYKARIIQLHIKEQKSLKQVNAILTREGLLFSANERQYRKIISEWEFDRNVKPDEIAAIVRKRQYRKIVENTKKKLVFEVRGAPVTSPKIDRWMKRYGASPSALYVPRSPKETPTTVQCWTPPDFFPPITNIDSRAAIPPVSPMTSTQTVTIALSPAPSSVPPHTQ